ncbi:MAG: hypothetical protein IPL92_01510 [Saprospiraceae bacterium]|nr:hypothetical protein [Candidatus Opimibacter iunctus]
MNNKYLAYIALLAGWICFCYWLYAERIAPRIHSHQEKSWPEVVEDLPYPLAYKWMSDIPYAGIDFGSLKESFHDLDSTDEIVLIHGYYFRDEANDINSLHRLGRNRINHALSYLDIDRKRLVSEVSVHEITADVRSNPFEAVRFERISMADLLHTEGDTIELCFPFADSLVLPQLSQDRLIEWTQGATVKNANMLHIVGTADGSGIAESSDMAMDRAIRIKEIIMNNGWKEEQLQLSTGQRNHPLTLRNRCVLVYFE